MMVTKIFELSMPYETGDTEEAEKEARSYLKDPDEWKTYCISYDPKTGMFFISFFQGELHDEDGW